MLNLVFNEKYSFNEGKPWQILEEKKLYKNEKLSKNNSSVFFQYFLRA